MTQSTPANTPELEWIQMRKDFDKEQIETGKEKFIRKFKQNPLIPIGESIMFQAYLDR